MENRRTEISRLPVRVRESLTVPGREVLHTCMFSLTSELRDLGMKGGEMWKVRDREAEVEVKGSVRRREVVGEEIKEEKEELGGEGEKRAKGMG